MEATTDFIELKLLEVGNYDELKQVMMESYPSMPETYWRKSHLKLLISKFPEGQTAVFVNGELAACALSIIVDFTLFDDQHTYNEITGNYSFSTHDNKGDSLYGLDIFVHPKFRGLRLGRRLYDYRKSLCEKLNLKAIMFGGRIPNYHKYINEFSPKVYIEKVRNKEIHDPVLDFQLSNDFHPRRILKGYLQEDLDSKEYAVLLKWENINYQKDSEKIQSRKSIVRLGLVQWQMRPYNNVYELMEQAEFFVDALSAYKSDFCMFPEFFNAPLMAAFNSLSEPDAIRELAKSTQEIVGVFSKLAISYNINIITGSMPELIDDTLHNVGYLCHRNGNIDRFEKIHVTPDEVKIWGLKGGNQVQSFETDSGKIGVLICYDIEFPELSRLLADEGMDILFVPFLTDTQNAYTRVRHCAQARAIENECYVAISGSVGNLPKVHNMDIQYSQSMVFTPCDFSFPTNGIKSEATPNAEMIVIADVDLNLLRDLHNFGSVKNLKDRRTDIYQLRKIKQKNEKKSEKN